MLNAPNVQEWLAAIGWIYLLFALSVAGVVWKLASPLPIKITGVIFVLGLFAYWPTAEILEKRREGAEFKAKYDVAAAIFNEHCKNAGDKIYKTVENVEGIRLVKFLPEERRTSDPTWEGAAFTSESGREFYIFSFLWYETNLDSIKQSGGGQLVPEQTPVPGFRFVEIPEGNHGKVNRYTYKWEDTRRKFVLHREADVTPAARYAVGIEDLPEIRDSKNWIAGGRIQIIDLKTNELIAEHRRFTFDRRMGSSSGGRQQWLFADHCPKPQFKPFKVRFFVDQVLKPIKENSK